jgi:hypothetical protein
MLKVLGQDTHLMQACITSPGIATPRAKAELSLKLCMEDAFG